jgi:hypothetical protein
MAEGDEPTQPRIFDYEFSWYGFPGIPPWSRRCLTIGEKGIFSAGSGGKCAVR